MAAADAVFEEQGTKITRTHATSISETGMDILEQIREARVAIANNELKDAKRETWEALQLASDLQAKSPTEDLRHRIEAARKALEKNGKLDRKADLTPIYEQLDVTDYARETDIRAYLSSAEKGSSVEKINESLASASADVGYLEVDLSLDKIVNDLRRAHHDLWQPGNRTNPQAANAELRDAQEHVHMIMGQASAVLGDDSDS
jgi:hypothetical protein